MDIVDAQIHSNVLGPPETLLQIMDALGVAAALIDEFTGTDKNGVLLPDYKLPDGTTRPIGPNAEGAALLYPDRLNYLMRMNPFDPGLEGWMESLTSSPNLKALRIVVFGPKTEPAFMAGEYDHFFRVAQKHNQPVFVFCPNNVKHLATYARRFPDVKFILDHCGVSFSKPGEASIDDALTLAACPNIAYKWAHAAVFLTKQVFPFPDLDPLIKRVVEAFGPQRVMWASDYTMTRHRSNWAESIFQVRSSPVLSDSDREWIMGRTCRTWLNWPAPQPTRKLPSLHPSM